MKKRRNYNKLNSNANFKEETEEEYLMRIDEEETWDRITEGGYGSG